MPDRQTNLRSFVIDNVKLLVGDYDAAIGFYRDVLGLRELWHVPEKRNAGFHAGSVILIIEQREQASSGTHLWFTVPDAAEMRANLVSAGAQCEAVRSYPGMTLVDFADPAGNSLGLIEPTGSYVQELTELIGRPLAL